MSEVLMLEVAHYINITIHSESALKNIPKSEFHIIRDNYCHRKLKKYHRQSLPVPQKLAAVVRFSSAKPLTVRPRYYTVCPRY